MANKTPFLDLIQPGYMEYKETWWEPLNQNFDTLDTWAESTDQEIKDARFSAVSLSAFLAVSHETSGQLKATPEVIRARNSAVYGFQTSDVVPANFTLGQRIDQVDWEVWAGREGAADLKALSAFRAPNPKHQIIVGAESSGYPDWLSSTLSTLKVYGKTAPLWFAIGGKLGRVRSDVDVAVTGVARTVYLYAQYLPPGDAGKIVVDGVILPLGTAGFGATSGDLSGNQVYFTDLSGSRDFWPMKNDNTLSAGDVLELTDSTEIGKYLIKSIDESIVVPGTSNQVTIVGTFPNGGRSGINYTITDPLAVTLGTMDSDSPTDDIIVIAEADFTGSGFSALRPRHFRDTFVGEWRQVSVTAGAGIPNLGTVVPGVYETKYDHHLGSDLLDITVQVSQSNTGSAPVEEMSLATLDASTLAVTINDGKSLVKTSTLVFSPATHAPDVLAPNTPQVYTQGGFSGGSLAGTIDYALAGSITGSKSGDVYMERSVKAKWDKNSIWIKNAVTDRFYKDYDGTLRTAGYIRVIVRKRG